MFGQPLDVQVPIIIIGEYGLVLVAGCKVMPEIRISALPYVGLA
jgi:hypothetical protein